MKGVRPPTYTKQGVLFKGWLPRKVEKCPVCRLLYITKVRTEISTIFVHPDNDLCQEFDNE